MKPRSRVFALSLLALLPLAASEAQMTPASPRRGQTAKPPLHARHWIAITGKPLGATAGAMMF
ncbi:MAG: hypothetical protein M3282_10705, partial [Gemmatimonadota bacterium]|nr:hypothetical protein [Gemmatimonadota bacterium]